MGCALETFEDILNLIHKESLTPGRETCDNECITHKFFGLQLCEEM
jgi:hypothetical protein